MKNIFFLLLITLLTTACTEKEARYKTKSPSIESAKMGIAAYEKQDWTNWKALYADSAKIYSNDWDRGLTPDEVLSAHKQMIASMESYEFQDEPQFFEETIDDDGKTWVNTWLLWKGKLKGSDKTLKVPVHLSTHYNGGKIVEEYGFWNMAEYEAEMNRLMNTPVEEQKLITKRDRYLKKFLNENSPAVLDETLGENFVRYMNGEKEAVGKQGLIDGMNVFHQGFPDLKLTNPRTIVKDNSLFVHWTFTGTNTGQFMGQPATGNRIKVKGLSEIRFNSAGEVYEEHVFFNQLDMMQQLGYSLTPPADQNDLADSE